jgi:hypothetical protein
VGSSKAGPRERCGRCIGAHASSAALAALTAIWLGSALDRSSAAMPPCNDTAVKLP